LARESSSGAGGANILYFCTDGSNSIVTSLGAPPAPLHRARTCGPPPGPAPVTIALLELTKCRSCIDTFDDDGSGRPDTLTDDPSALIEQVARGVNPRV
jgi:hypothetical protein